MTQQLVTAMDHEVVVSDKFEDAMCAALKRDSKFLAQPASVQAVYEHFTTHISEILGEFLDQPLTLELLLKVKISFVKGAIERGFFDKVLDATPDEAFGVFDRETFRAMNNGMLGSLIGSLEEFIQGVPEFLEENSISEQDALFGPQLGLTAETKGLYHSGELTIRRLLEVQPGVIFFNQ